jgi:hypothetical protein
MNAFSSKLCFTLATLAVLFIGCGSEEPAECVASHCIEGETACFGTGFASCSAAGTWQVSGCGAASYCNPATKSCESRSCSKPGVGTCVANDKVSVCSEDGAYMDEVACATDESCSGGACLKTDCTQGTKVCAFGKDGPVVMLCDGIWKVDTECEASQLCSTDSGSAQCVQQACVPDARSCDGEVAVVCSGSGDSETRTSCASNQTCSGGVCVAKICGAGTTQEGDASGATDASVEDDAGPVEEDVFIPPTETIAMVEFDIGNIHHTFDLNAQAMYITGDSQLVILGQSGVRQMELRISPLDPDDVGNWTDTGDSEVGVLFCYNDGVGDDQPFGGCQVGFTHASIEYDVTLEANNGKGSWLKGTFSTTLINAANEQVRLQNGEFNVIFK